MSQELEELATPSEAVNDAPAVAPPALQHARYRASVASSYRTHVPSRVAAKRRLLFDALADDGDKSAEPAPA